VWPTGTDTAESPEVVAFIDTPNVGGGSSVFGGGSSRGGGGVCGCGTAIGIRRTMRGRGSGGGGLSSGGGGFTSGGGSGSSIAISIGGSGRNFRGFTTTTPPASKPCRAMGAGG